MTTHTLSYDKGNSRYQVFNILPSLEKDGSPYLNLIRVFKVEEGCSKEEAFSLAICLVNYLNGGVTARERLE